MVIRFVMISFTCKKKTFAVDGLRRSADVVVRQVEGDGFQQWEGVLALRSAVVKIHQQFSHSLIGEDLARHLRPGAASEKAIKAARALKYQRCEAEKRSLPLTIWWQPITCQRMHQEDR